MRDRITLEKCVSAVLKDQLSVPLVATHSESFIQSHSVKISGIVHKWGICRALEARQSVFTSHLELKTHILLIRLWFIVEWPFLHLVRNCPFELVQFLWISLLEFNLRENLFG